MGRLSDYRWFIRYGESRSMNEQFTSLFASMNTVRKVEWDTAKVLIEVSDFGHVVVGHQPMEVSLLRQEVRKLFMVFMLVVVQIESIAFDIVGWIKVDEHVAEFVASTNNSLEEIDGVHVVYVDAIPVEMDLLDTADELVFVVTGIEFPFSCLVNAPDRSTVDHDAGSIAPVQVEARKGHLDSGVPGLVPVDFALPFPFGDGDLCLLKTTDEVVFPVKDSIPKGIDARVSVVQDNARHMFGEEKIQGCPRPASIRFNVGAILQAVDIQDIGQKLGEHCLPSWISQWTVNYRHTLNTFHSVNSVSRETKIPQ